MRWIKRCFFVAMVIGAFTLPTLGGDPIIIDPIPPEATLAIDNPYQNEPPRVPTPDSVFLGVIGLAVLTLWRRPRAALV